MATISPIRPSPLAGTWYEGDPKALSQAVDRYMDEAKLPALSGKIIAVIAPHAGHTYSGPVAGYAFAAVRGSKPDMVVVVSPMHQPYRNPLLTTSHSAYETPLGNILVNEEAVFLLNSRLKKRLGYGLTSVAYDQEHSLEIELPFLQRALEGEFQLLPVMVRSQSREVSEQLGIALAEVIYGKNALLVASTDLSHFYSQKQADELDAEMLRRVKSFTPEDLFQAEIDGRGYACGLGALAAVLWASRDLGADQVQILRHATSGDVTGDLSSVVGYGAAAVLKSVDPQKPS